MLQSSAGSRDDEMSQKRSRIQDHDKDENVTEDAEHTASEQDRGKYKSTPVLLDAKRDYFERILITMEMMQDHFPDSYLSVINKL